VSEFHFPDSTTRTAVLGMTGSGKSVFGCWLLSHAAYDRMPWLIVDHKDDPDEIFNRVNKRCVQEIDPGDPVPKKPGLYIVKPLPEEEDDAMDRTFRNLWSRGGIGVFVDEGHLIDARASIFKIMLTTGRSLRIPMIVCSQRPVGVTPYLFTQSNYFAVFQLETEADIKTVQGHLASDITAPLPEYHCRWRDRKARTTQVLAPVDDPDTIVDRFNRRAPQPFWW
jgi:hypothetical protein